jgi:hypothetical protein
MELEALRRHSLCYVASPYSNYADGLDAAFADIGAVTWRLHQAGVKCYSPVVYCHPIARALDANPLDADFWMAFTRPVLDRCDALIVVDLPGWDASYGISKEIERFEDTGRPVYHLAHQAMRLAAAA